MRCKIVLHKVRVRTAAGSTPSGDKEAGAATQENDKELPSRGLHLCALPSSAHIGYSKDATFITGDKYADWSLGATYTWRNATFGVSYVDTDQKKGFLVTPGGRDIAKAGVVGSVTYAF